MRTMVAVRVSLGERSRCLVLDCAEQGKSMPAACSARNPRGNDAVCAAVGLPVRHWAAVGIREPVQAERLGDAPRVERDAGFAAGQENHYGYHRSPFRHRG